MGVFSSAYRDGHTHVLYGADDASGLRPAGHHCDPLDCPRASPGWNPLLSISLRR